MAQLLTITHDGPVSVRFRGHAGNGVVKTYQADELVSAVEMINACGGPNAWEITPL